MPWSEYPLRTLVLPGTAGPGDPQIVIGPDIPPELVTFYGSSGATITAAIIFRTSATEYSYIAVANLTIGPVTGPATVAGLVNSNIVGREVFQTDFRQYPTGTGVAEAITQADSVSMFGADLAYVWGDLSTIVECASGILELVAPNIDVIGDTVVTGDLDVTGQLGGVGTYTPALLATTTDPNLGATAVTDGQWYRQGRMMDVTVNLQASGAGISAGSGNYRVTLPTAIDGAPASATLGQGRILGSGLCRDDSSVTANSRTFVCQAVSTAGGPGGVGTLMMAIMDGTNTQISAGTPFTLAANDRFALHIRYPTQ